MDATIGHLQRNSQRDKGVDKCAHYVGNAIEAGGVRLNRGLNNSAKRYSAYGYGPILEDAGFIAMPEGTELTDLQIGDVVVIQPIPKYHPHGHAAMYDGEHWRSDFNQGKEIYPSARYERVRPAYTIYRRSSGQ
jgi:hypothetical protein